MTNIFAPLQGLTKPVHIASVANYQPLTLRTYLSEDNPTEEELLWLVRTLYTLNKHSDSLIRAYTKFEKVRKERELKELGVLEGVKINGKTSIVTVAKGSGPVGLVVGMNSLGVAFDNFRFEEKP